MEGGEGMVAVVRGLRDSGLAVTLLDGNRQYTLMQNAAQQAPPVHPTQGQMPQSEAQILYPQYPQHHQFQTRSPSEAEEPLRCDSGAQATDGRYASMYKTAHCNVAPTSPPVQITEFPPQKAELCRGHGNFEVGGQGSGEHYVPTRVNGSFRGAMSWPDRGSVCSPRQSREPDAFAESLRKYPSPSIERSSEMVERLITYTQAKNFPKNNQQRYPSPPRHGTESYTSNLVLDHSISRNTFTRCSSYQKSYEPEVNVSARSKLQVHESPTRDLRPNEHDSDCRRLMKNTDNYNSSTKVENLKNFSAYPCNQPLFNQSVRCSYAQEKSRKDMATSSLTATTSANMEIQAAAEMVSREVATVPREEPIKRTVAVPLSPTSSNCNQKGKGEVSIPPYTLKSSFKSVQTTNMPVDLSIQTKSSNIDIANTLLNSRNIFKRNSKSEEDIKISESRDEIIDLLEKVLMCPNADPGACDFRRYVLKEMSNERHTMFKNVEIKEENEKIKKQKLLKYVPVWDSCGDIECFKDAISNEIISQMNDYKAFNDVFRADIQLGIRKDTDDLYELIFSCLCHMPIQTMDIFGKPVLKNSILNAYVKRIEEVLITHKSNRGTLKSVILDVIYGIPLAMKTCNKLGYLNKIVDSLIKKLYSLNKYETGMNEHKMPITENLKTLGNSFKLYVQPTEDELKECIATELKDFFEENNVHEKVTRDIEVEIIDFLIDIIEPIRTESYPYEDFEEEMSMLLHQRVANLSQYQARKFTEAIFQKIIGIFRLKNPNDDSVKKTSETKRDKDSNSDIYMHHLTQQIDEWFENLNLQNPEVHNTIFRQVVVSDLASEILERHKYLVLNPSAKGTKEDEMEHLKYQIFKWINNLTGENNMATIENASELMQRIQRISKPLQIPHQQNNARTDILASKRLSLADASRFNVAHTGLVKNRNTKQILPMSTANKSNITTNFNQSLSNSNHVSIPCCAGSSLKPTTPSMKQLNEDYDNFLKEWVQKIPIPTSTAQEKAVVDKVRIGIYNGIWKAITKLKFEPEIFHNPFCYEDALDDEVEELLGSLPKSQELEDRKHLLKVQLIEKTTNTNELIKSTSAPSSFRQQLLENVSISLPRKNTTSNKNVDFKQLYESLQISKLVEDYILCVRYTDVDIVKANIYRKKLIKEVQTLIEKLKKILGKELVDIDTDIYTTNILNALHKVPLPNEETIKDEADEILLSLEVEQWLLDLPIIQNNDVNDQIQRRKLKDQLVKKLLEIEREVNIFDCTGERVLKHEVSIFLSKLPIQEEHKNNISFMAEEFANRMKNRAKQLQGNGTRKSVAFLDSVGYYEFSRNMQSCSSFSNLPGARPALRDQSSYMIRGGSLVRDTSLTNETSISSYKYRPQTNANYGQAHSLEPLPSDQYFTLEESQGHHNQPPALQSRMMQQPQTISNENWQPIPDAYGSPERQFVPMASVSKAQGPLEWQSVPMASMSNVKRSPESQLNPCCRNASNIQSIAPGILTQGPRAEDQLDQYIQRHSLPLRPGGIPEQYTQRNSLPANIPLEAINPCCSSGQENANLGGIVRQSLPTLLSNPEVIRDINQTEEVITHPGLGVPVAMSLSRREQSINENIRETSLQRVPDNISREIHQQCLPDQRELSQPRSPGNTSTYGEPQGFSTPQQLITQGSPPKPGRKKTQNTQNFRKGFARRRLELEDDTEDDLESEGDEPCPCMKRMFRYQRGHPCYEDFERDDWFPMPYGSSSLVMNNFTVQLCGNVAQNFGSTILEEKGSKSMKSVQTSFSSVDLPAEKCSQRKIKSQEDLRNSQSDHQLQAGVLEWLKEVYTSASNTHVWEEKMKRLAQKLTEPGEEKKMRQKIQKYLIRAPIQFSDGDEENREFREHLPDNIIRKLKKINLKLKKRKADHSSPVRIFRIEIPKHDTNDSENIDIVKQSVNNWLKDIPIKDKDFLGRKISTSDVSNLIVNNLEPYLLNIHNFDVEFKAKMKSVLVEILNEIPIELDISDRTSYLTRIAISLINDIVKASTSNKSNEYFDNVQNSFHKEDLNKFVVNEIVNIIDKLHLNLDFKRLDLLEEELKETLMKLSEPNNIGDAREDINLILNNLGGLSTYQTHYFTDVIIKHFREKFKIITSNERNDQQATCDDTLALLNTKSNDQHENNENTKSVNNPKEMADIAALLCTENVVRKQINLGSSNVMVFGVTLSDKCKETTICTTGESIKEINDEDIEASSDLYLKQLIEQIEIWLGTLNIPQIHDKGFREIAVSDLASDIIDRHKYLEMNPSSRGTAENELEQLRYQIFKWINKLVGEEQTETMQRASELMRRIQNIPVPMFIKNGDQNQSACHSRSIKETFIRNTSKTNQLKDSVTSPENKETIFPPVSNNSTTNNKSNVATDNTNSLMGLKPNPVAITDRKVNQKRAIDSETRIPSSGETKTNLYKLSNELLDNHSAIPRIPTSRNKNTVTNESRPTSGFKTSPTAKYSQPETELLPPGIPLNEVYPYFDEIFKARVMEIPIDTPTPEQEMLADMARKGLYNGIWKTYFHLKGDPDIENDYSYFAVMLEEKIDDMLDCLPQTQEMQKLRPPWKVKVLNDVMTMLKYVHSLTDTPSFRQQISEKIDRQFLRAQFAASSNIYRNDFVVRTADAYILYSKYKEEDPTKANIYRQRLMTKIEELAESVKASNNIDFRHINQAQLCQIAMQILESVPIPHDEIFKEEADEILMGEEIEQWYKALPVKPVINETHEILRKRMRELLAKKICDIEKRMDIDEASAELNVKHEVSKFLHEDAYLQQDEDLNINFMIDELTNRLKTKRQQNLLGYETFEKETPFSSTFAQTDPGEALAGFINVGEQANKSQNVGKDPNLMHASKAATSSHHHFSNDLNVPPSCCQDRAMGMSQIEQPSRPSQIFAPNTSRASQRPVFSSMDRSNGLTGARQNQMIEANEQVLYDQGGIANKSQMPTRPEVPLNNQVPYPVNQGYNQAVGRSSLGMPSNQPENQFSQAHIPRPELLPSNQQPYQVSRGYRAVDRRRWSLPSGQPQSQNTQVYMPSVTLPPDLGQPYQVNQDYNPVLDKNRLSLPSGPQPRRNGQAHLSSYPKGPRTGFTTQATGATSSTARVASPIVQPQQEEDEETDAEEEVRYKCRCMERIWKCKRRHYYEDRDRRPRCRPSRPPMPYPCCYFY